MGLTIALGQTTDKTVTKHHCSERDSNATAAPDRPHLKHCGSCDLFRFSIIFLANDGYLRNVITSFELVRMFVCYAAALSIQSMTSPTAERFGSLLATSQLHSWFYPARERERERGPA
jgi:hypothetical protein